MRRYYHIGDKRHWRNRADRVIDGIGRERLTALLLRHFTEQELGDVGVFDATRRWEVAAGKVLEVRPGVFETTIAWPSAQDRDCGSVEDRVRLLKRLAETFFEKAVVSSEKSA